MTRLRHPPGSGQAQAELVRHSRQDVPGSLLTPQPRGTGPHGGHCCADGRLSMQLPRCNTAISQAFSSWVMQLHGCFCTVLHPSHKSSSRVQAHRILFPSSYTPCSGSSLRPVHSALVSQYPWDKRLTHIRESFRIQTRHKIIKYFKNRTLALSSPKVFSSLSLSKGLKAAQWRNQSTATLGTGLSQQVPTFQ